MDQAVLSCHKEVTVAGGTDRRRMGILLKESGQSLSRIWKARHKEQQWHRMYIRRTYMYYVAKQHLFTESDAKQCLIILSSRLKYEMSPTISIAQQTQFRQMGGATIKYRPWSAEDGS